VRNKDHNLLPTRLQKLSTDFLKLVVVSLLLAALLMAMQLAPMEQSMGQVQRILYIHVSVAWLGLLGFATMGGCAICYLFQRNLAWDQWSQAANEVGWLCSSLTLLTGSFWAHAAWGTWWTWDPRLTTSFVLWTLYSGCLIVRGSLQESHQSARITSSLAILGLLDLPLVIMATRWFRGIHPVSPEMEPMMLFTLLLNLVGFTLFFTLLFMRRRNQLGTECLLQELEQKTLVNGSV
jgi:heme exporter protein C